MLDGIAAEHPDENGNVERKHYSQAVSMVKTMKHTKVVQPTALTSDNPDDSDDNSNIYDAPSATNDGSESSDGTEIVETISNDDICF